MLKVDYTLLLSRVVAPISEQHLLSIKQMREKLEYLDDTIKLGKNIRTEIKQLEEAIRLRMSYINMLLAAEELCGDSTLEEDSKFEKEEVVKSAQKKSKDAEKEANSIENMNKYEVLSLKKGATAEEIMLAYETFLRKLKERLDLAITGEVNIDQAKMREAEKLFYQKRSAFELLTNPERKIDIDERMTLNFEADRSSLYTKGAFAQISYMPESYLVQKRKIDAIEVMRTHNSRGDQILITKTGTLGFGRFRQENGKLTYVDNEALHEYQIVKTYADLTIAEERRRKCQSEIPSRWDEKNNGEIFTVYGDLNRDLLTSQTTGKEYKRYVVDVYLSNANLQAAIEHNCGYIGEVGLDRETGEYRVNHGQDQLCLAYEFKEIRKRNGPIGIPMTVALDNTKRGIELRKEGESK